MVDAWPAVGSILHRDNYKGKRTDALTQNLILEEDVNHDRTGRPVVGPYEGAPQTRFSRGSTNSIWKTKQITIALGDPLFAYRQSVRPQC